MGHANPEGAGLLWQKINQEIYVGGADENHFRINYKQMMGRKNLFKVGVRKTYDIRTGLNDEQKKSIALSIFLDVSYAFEKMQSN